MSLLIRAKLLCQNVSSACKSALPRCSDIASKSVPRARRATARSERVASRVISLQKYLTTAASAASCMAAESQRHEAGVETAGANVGHVFGQSRQLSWQDSDECAADMALATEEVRVLSLRNTSWNAAIAVSARASRPRGSRPTRDLMRAQKPQAVEDDEKRCARIGSDGAP